MDFLSELENMVTNVKEHQGRGEVIEEDLNRWQTLFGLTASGAESRIREHRDNLTRERISDEHWDMICDQQAPLGHDKESYEYSLQYRRPAIEPKRAQNAEYLLKLGGPLNSLSKVRKAAGGLDRKLVELPALDDNEEDVSFVIVDGREREAILQQCSLTRGAFRPVFVRLSKARKALCAYSAYPTLGIDTSLPQFRPDAEMKEQYPVWYFFYGSLAEPERLARLLRIKEGEIKLLDAHIFRGELKLWAKKYKALVDGEQRVDGWAYLVLSREDEDALRCYETEKYEVVRCKIHTEGTVRDGLTFRFVDKNLLVG